MLPLRILLLSDGRPGHYNLSEGIALAIGRRRKVEIARIEVNRGRWPGLIMAGAVNAGLPASAIIKHLYGLAPEKLPEADLIVSAGAHTLAANIAAARTMRAANVFYGSLRTFRPADFTLVLTSYAGRAVHANTVMTLKPAPFDPALLPAVEPPERGLPSTVAVMLGGDVKRSIRYAPADWDALIAGFEYCHRAAGTRFIVSNSRRTPREASDRLAGLAAVRSGPIARFVDVRQPGAARPFEIFASAGAVLVSADSSSMLSEAVWARRPTIALAPRRCVLEANEAGYRRYMQEQGWIGTLPIHDLAAGSVASMLGGLTPIAINPLDGLAELLEARLNLQVRR